MSGMTMYYDIAKRRNECFTCRTAMDKNGNCQECSAMTNDEIAEQVRIYDESIESEIILLRQDSAARKENPSNYRANCELRYFCQVHRNRINLWSRSRARLIRIRDSRKETNHE